MKRTKIIFFCCLATACGVLGLEYGLSGDLLALIGALVTGCLWVLGQRQKWSWLTSLAFIGLIGFASTGVLQGLSSIAMLGCVVAALTAWDLERFMRRIAGIAPDKARVTLETFHLRRLLIVNGSGLVLAGIAGLVTLRISLGLLVLICLILVLSLGRTFRVLAPDGDEIELENAA